MDKQEFLEFSIKELSEIEILKNDIKANKLQSFFIDLLEHNDLDYIQKIVDRKIDFYSHIETIEILKKSIEIITINIFRPSIEIALQNIKDIQEDKYMYMKNMFVDSLVHKLTEIEKDFLIEDGLTSPQIEGSPYHKKILNIAQQVLEENPQYVEKFESISLKEFVVLSQVIHLNNKFPEKNVKEKKAKI